MGTFQYKAIDRIGRPARGRLDAANDVDLELRLKRLGLDLVAFRAVEARQQGSGGIDRRDLITLCFDLEQMSRAGIPLLDGLRDLRDGVDKPRLREILAAVVEDMEGGKLLSQCLAQHRGVFNHFFVSLVKAGEQSGTLTEVFENLGATLRMQDELIAQTRRLLVYPTLVLLVVSAVVVFLLLYLVPQVSSLLRTMGIDMPPQTRALIGASGFLAGYWHLVLGLPLAALAAAVFAVATNERARWLYDLVKLRLPLTGPILQKIILARFANVFALLYRSGITVLDALKTSEEIVHNRVIADGVARAGQQISAGVGLTDAFRETGLFPPLVIRMLRVGEQTGALDRALANVTYFYNREVKESIERGLKVLEPTLIMLLGGVLLVIMWSVLGPVYDILGKLRI